VGKACCPRSAAWGTRTYTYDAADRLTRVTALGGVVTAYPYDAQTSPTKGPYWSHHDGLGSVTDVTSSSGTSLWWMEYTPFGTPRASGSMSQAPTNLFRFTGAYLDTPSGLYHLRARQYDPALGRFLSPDPPAGPITEPAVGAYVYVRDNPTNRVGPSGKESLPVGATNPAGCVAGLAGFTALAEVSGVVALAGPSLQGFSGMVFGFSVGTTGPVTRSSFFAGLLLEGIGAAGEAAAGYALYATCIQSGR
jgi:RHS repeat-associated protein